MNTQYIKTSLKTKEQHHYWEGPGAEKGISHKDSSQKYFNLEILTTGTITQ